MPTPTQHTSDRLWLSVAIGYVLLSIVLIASSFLQQHWLDDSRDIYSAMSVDLPDITRLVFKLQPHSYILSLLTVFAAGWFHVSNRSGRRRTAAFMLLNLALIACIAWRELATYAYQLPVLHLLRMQ